MTVCRLVTVIWILDQQLLFRLKVETPFCLSRDTSLEFCRQPASDRAIDKGRSELREKSQEVEWKNTISDLDIVAASVTRFGEISPLGQTFKNLRQNIVGLYFVLQNFEPILAIFY